MKILSLNMRGWGNTAKRRRLSSLIQSGAYELCFLQETKRCKFDDSMVNSLWGHSNVEWLAKASCGLSGGLLTVWKRDLFNFRFSFTIRFMCRMEEYCDLYCEYLFTL
ncbi:unnamed protein product [Trifolium pratense]|uniref:Uncharacterized protein n=1 Tax=Trifolium pratense TaxID=57577 RepID=A0ACB0J182_TRIPR|nr:unnamed protein product [Trifolium pratense]